MRSPYRHAPQNSLMTAGRSEGGVSFFAHLRHVLDESCDIPESAILVRASKGRHARRLHAVFYQPEYFFVRPTLRGVCQRGRMGKHTGTPLRSSFADTPVIMVSARREEIDTVVGLEVGADDYVAKPVDRETLIAVCAGLTGRRGAAPDAVAV